jgi:hypothetical protein
MRMLRAIRDWAHKAAHPEDSTFASAERRVVQTRTMFETANVEFAEVMSVLGVKGYKDVRWPEELIEELMNAFDASRS